jgi:hypothetical protein
MLLSGSQPKMARGCSSREEEAEEEEAEASRLPGST